ncbi:chloramphenicol-sensitive protein RarD [Virgibacillus subterraneus]|uniref:Chloramphenicol-sensitive protein RarD n=2 Tax=Virgibacillus TaxID=84406 RepID=A0A1H0Y8Y9_9BACI|nr:MULTISPECIES: EamA family transporter RarD [Virgibacillus]SDQ11635.1 chloramphenicol-sensitive protein RarD [Virgibacillus salinus]SEP70341.1 chloramphenicol-sensitive protein RarD [Virgibacillus subterraneus]
MNQENKIGIIYAAGAYLLWGFLPAYWKLIDQVPPDEILAHRILWSFIFMIIVVLVVQKWKLFLKECRIILNDRKKLTGITFASVAISINWLTFIWAVNNEHVIQASLGYYINPLVSILLGMIVLKETLTRGQMLSFLLAAVGVINLTISYGVFPWVSLLLAFSFAIYGLLKKTVDVSAMFGLTIETMIVTPIALIYLLSIPGSSLASDPMFSSFGLLLFGAGVVTAIPLLLFASGAKRIPLSMVGFLQYIAPTIMLVLGVFVYQETFSLAHFISFALIWIALFIYMSSAHRSSGRLREKN